MARLTPEALAAVRSLAEGHELRIYEGLPHPRDEPDLLEHEAVRVRVVELMNDRFYPARQHVSPEDEARLRTAARQPGWFEAVGFRSCDGRHEDFDAVKMCLFHPDFALQWRSGAGEDAPMHRILFCFGCNESVFFDDQFEVTSYTALTPELREILLRYRRERPSSEAWPPRT